MQALEILALIKGAAEIAVDIIPLIVRRDSAGKVTGFSIVTLLENAPERNAETLRLIAEAMTPKKPAPPH